MGLKDVIEEKVEIELGGKTYQLKIFMKELAKFQKEYSGWLKAFQKLSFVGTEMEGMMEINYDVLAGMLAIAIGQNGIDKEFVYPLLEDLKDEELAELVKAIVSARKKAIPEPKDKTVEVVEHLEAAKALLLADRRETEVSAFEELLVALKEEVADSQDDPPKQTA